ncbi:FecR family protein [Tistrella bauzanensis]
MMPHALRGLGRRRPGRALGTTFSITRDDQTARVVVVAGQVEARAADGAVVALEAGQAVTMGRSVAGAPMIVERVDAAALTAWHRGRLIVAGQPLAQVAARLERDSRLRLIVRGNTARNLPVTGVFNLDDPAGTLAAITRILPVRARRIGPLVILDA